MEFSEAAGFDARFDAVWAELVEQNPKTLLGVRDSAALRWHYGVPLRAGRLTISPPPATTGSGRTACSSSTTGPAACGA